MQILKIIILLILDLGLSVVSTGYFSKFFVDDGSCGTGVIADNLIVMALTFIVSVIVIGVLLYIVLFMLL